MQFAYLTATLASLALALAAPLESRATALTASDSSLLTSLGFHSAGINAVAPNGQAWIGTQGPYTNEFSNTSGEPIILVVWGPAKSWVNANQPLITHSLAPGAKTTLSFATGASGGFSAVHPGTKLLNGQVSNTWGEYTFVNSYSTFDVSREPNMSGNSISITGPQCVSDMKTCVFTCNAGNTCMTGYSLTNCATGSQKGATYGTFGGAPSGGCAVGANTAALKTSLGK